MCLKKKQTSNLSNMWRLESLTPLLYTHGTVAKPTVPIPSAHYRSRYTIHNRFTWNASYSSALSTRRCHHPSVRCWRRVQDTAGLSHPRIQRGVTVASCGARCDRPSASRARMQSARFTCLVGCMCQLVLFRLLVCVCAYEREGERARYREKERDREMRTRARRRTRRQRW
jgi:hypothetical protein